MTSRSLPAVALTVLAVALAGTVAGAPPVSRRTPVVDAVERVSPAVVNISTEVIVRNPYARTPDIFDWFFGGGPRRGRQYYVENSLGSGVIVDSRGYVLTNNHVIAAASRITVTFVDGKQVEADLVGSDQATDLAVLKLQGEGPWPSVAMGSSADLMVGETAIAIGNPFGLQSTVTTGVISATGRMLPGPDEGAIPFADFIQTDAAINPGNSGGALLNIRGELIGINTQIVAKGQNLGFAIPIDRARKVLRELRDYGYLRPAWTGLVVEDLDRQLAEYYGMESREGVLVVKIYRDSPATEAHFRLGDVIIAVGSRKVTNIADWDTAIAQVEYGRRVNVRLVRKGEEVVHPLRVVAFPAERAEDFAWSVLGFTVTDRRGLVVIDKVRAHSKAAEIGLVSGLAVRSLAGHKVRSAKEFYEFVPQILYRRSADLVIAARRGLYRIPLPIR
ncbi:MAG: trypsin-like peptidase domain-containing protein [Acidobacteriota bacterium]|nr:trypsin-like peptidase domain-containing protein [Acidobacteriota bacterium]